MYRVFKKIHENDQNWTCIRVFVYSCIHVYTALTLSIEQVRVSFWRAAICTDSYLQHKGTGIFLSTSEGQRTKNQKPRKIMQNLAKTKISRRQINSVTWTPNSQPRFLTATDDTTAVRAIPRSQRTPLPTSGGDFSLLSPLAFSVALSTPHVENANYGYPTTASSYSQQQWMAEPSKLPGVAHNKPIHQFAKANLKLHPPSFSIGDAV